MLDQVAVEDVGLVPGPSRGLQERDALEHERHRQHDVADQEVGRRLRGDQFLDAVGDGDGGTGDEQA